MKAHRVVAMVLGGFGLLLSEVPASPFDGEYAQLVARDRMRDVIEVRDLRLDDDGGLSGVVVNRSTNPVRDVKLSLRYEWLWNNEMRPGEDPPGRAAYYTVPQGIPPGGQVAFRYRPDSPLPMRSDGHFVPSGDVVSVTELLQGTAAVPPGLPPTRVEPAPSATR